MKYLIVTASAALLLSFATTASFAEDQTNTGPTRHRMGDEGKLPASSSTSSRVPEMGAETGSSTGTEGSSHRMGDEGKLPATNSMSNRVRKMHRPTDK